MFGWSVKIYLDLKPLVRRYEPCGLYRKIQRRRAVKDNQPLNGSPKGEHSQLFSPSSFSKDPVKNN
jgi:hypothetical protein